MTAAATATITIDRHRTPSSRRRRTSIRAPRGGESVLETPAMGRSPQFSVI
jgi:hypothetical protein